MNRIAASLFFLAMASLSLPAQKLTILHTNDMHSRLMGFGTESDYTPQTPRDDQTIGGFARISALISEHRKIASSSLLVLDAGDFLMGTVFHTAEEETGFELRLMKKMGYDLVALGNHEFDFGIGTLTKILEKSAEGDIPGLLLSNISFNADHPEDDAFENLYKTGVLKTWRILERNGVKIGFFSLMGEEAALVAPYVKPAVFTDRIAKAKEISKYLKETERVDLVICLSHSGVIFDTKKGWIGEDIDLAKQVPDIDVIIGGHSHSTLAKPIMVNNIPIVQAGSEGRFVGKLEIEKTPAGVVVLSGELIPVNDEIVGDPVIQRMITDQQALIGEKLFKPFGFSINKPIVETAYDVRFNEETNLKTSNLGPFLADALYGYLKTVSPADVVLVTAGLTRDEILKGKTGMQLPADLFRIFPLGLGVSDKAPGYSMSKVYVTGAELKTVLDVMLIAPAISTGNYPYWSGVKFKYNSLRIPLDRIYDIEIGNDADGYAPIKISKDPDKLYCLATNAYVLEFFGLIKKITKGILKVVPKYADGTPIPDLKLAIIDRDPAISGIQEVKEWAALITYASKLPDTNGNGVPDMPEKYREVQPYADKSASINPVKLFRGTNGITVIPAVIEAGLVVGAIAIIL